MSYKTVISYHPLGHQRGVFLEVTHYEESPVLTKVEDENGMDITKAVPEAQWEEFSLHVQDYYLNGYHCE